MKIIVNGRETEVSGGINITSLLEEVKAEDPLYVTVQLNGIILKTADFDTQKVKENDVVEFLYFMGGGKC
ncbi:thiamine biosynthesis protein ThiS [Spirochaetia bacterium]|nr:thiamine biosynthesis protein ThiS [Spirochaetia bacterium]